ncbi:MAG: GNAT family N-acetyltransferase [Chitinophagaceae bacterium]|nr:GNAT family N-acetyltransferase [Chitinophagaceae bacterium]
MNVIDQAQVRSATANDYEAVVKLLQSENLPAEDIPTGLCHFFVIEHNGNIVSVAGIEVYGQEGLLRSMVVDKHYRNQSLATTLLNKILGHAIDQGIARIYLITTTAEKYFAAKGFSVVHRTEVPSSISSSQEFSKLCPSTAIVMTRKT